MTTSKIPPFVILTGTPALNRAVQLLCFDRGITWGMPGLRHLDRAVNLSNCTYEGYASEYLEWDFEQTEPQYAKSVRRFNAATDLAAFAEFLENLPKDEPAYWSKPEHVPGPVCWLRFGKKTGEAQVIRITPSGVVCHHEHFGEEVTEKIPWRDIDDTWEYSTTRAKDSWKPCRVEVEG